MRGPLDQCIKKIENRFSGRDGSQCLMTPKEVQVCLTTPVTLALTSVSATLSVTSPQLWHTCTSSAPLAMQKDEEECWLKLTIVCHHSGQIGAGHEVCSRSPQVKTALPYPFSCLCLFLPICFSFLPPSISSSFTHLSDSPLCLTPPTPNF